MKYKKITFVGAGNMTRSIIAGLVASQYPAEYITATNPSQAKLDELRDSFSINTSNDNLVPVEEADVVVLAVKPQLMEKVAQELKHMDLSNKLIISIAAGIKCERLYEMFAQTLKLVRVMPNTPSLIGLGMSGLFASQSVDSTDKSYASTLMESVGKVCWVEEESGINGVIAAAGSSPAYFFLFLEAMQAEAMAQGFDKQTSRTLVEQAALGAAQMVIANPDMELSTLREQVTSKGGATAEAIRTFTEHQLGDTVAKAMQAAVTRAEEMEQLF